MMGIILITTYINPTPYITYQIFSFVCLSAFYPTVHDTVKLRICARHLIIGKNIRFHGNGIFMAGSDKGWICYFKIDNKTSYIAPTIYIFRQIFREAFPFHSIPVTALNGTELNWRFLFACVAWVVVILAAAQTHDFTA